jgi:hypothetical protein
MPSQDFNTVRWNESPAPTSVGDVVADALVNQLLGGLGQVLPQKIKDDLKDEIKADILPLALPVLRWETRVEGGCDRLCSTIIELGNQYLKGATGVTFDLKVVFVGASVDIQLKAQVTAENYIEPCPCRCFTNPRHMAWAREKQKIQKKNAEWDEAHQKWLKDMEAYKKLLKEKGSAFDPNGVPYPTPQWPPEVEGLKHDIPPEPPPGRQRCREFHILWTAQIKVSGGAFATLGGTWNTDIAEQTEQICTSCCD